MNVREVIRVLLRANPGAIVVLQRPTDDGFSPATGIDEAQCAKTVVDDDGGIGEYTTPCVVLYLAETGRAETEGCGEH